MPVTAELVAPGEEMADLLGAPVPRHEPALQRLVDADGEPPALSLDDRISLVSGEPVRPTQRIQLLAGVVVAHDRKDIGPGVVKAELDPAFFLVVSGSGSGEEAGQCYRDESDG